MAKFKQIMPVLEVADMQKAIDWYTKVIGFELLWRAPDDGDGENCMLRAGAATLMLSAVSKSGDKPAFTGTLYFGTDGVADLWSAVKDRVKVVWPLEAMEYGTVEFGIHDCDGYTLAFAESRSAAGDVRAST